MIVLMMLVAAGCSQPADLQLQEGKVNVMTTIYPLYDFAAKIGGEHANVMNVVPAGVEPHDWTPKSRDMVNMSKAEVFVHNGVDLEGWVPDFLQSLKSDSKLIVMEASRNAELIDRDPHVWLSPKQSKVYAANIKDALIQADPAHQKEYEANYSTLIHKLDTLDRMYTEALSKTTRKEIVVSHEAFAYLCRDYGLTQKAIMGLAAEAEPTARDIKEISDFIKEHQVKYIYFEELISDKLAKTLANDLRIDAMVLNPLEGLTENELRQGNDYFSVMESNLQNLLKGLQ
jgi:zinc transport system substrate-binding protein